MATQKDIAQNMIDQLRATDPAISAEIGTPERMIIDTVAQALAEAQIDLNVLQGALDVDAKLGTDLDAFLSLFGFGRQQGAQSTGYVKFGRSTTAAADIRIPAGSQLLARGAGSGGIDVVFYTTSSATLSSNATSVIVPIASQIAGVIANVDANTIIESYNKPIVGITTITNDYATTGGLDPEADNEMKARFKATGPFRNLSGTESQYLATAISTLAKKASVIGPVTRYKEYIQVPATDDSSDGNGAVNQFTTALSINKNAKYVYDNIPYHLTKDANYPSTHYKQDIDFAMNFTGSAKNRGDAFREFTTGVEISPTSTAATNRPNVTLTNVWISSASSPSTAIVPGDVLLSEYSYLSKASRNNYERGILNCVDVYINNNDYKLDTAVIPRPGINIPVILFTSTSSSAFYIDNYRRINEPEHRPVIGNIFTPLFNQPAIDVPNTISLSDTTYYKGIHYWAVQDVTAIGGTVRARNGIEWSSTIRGAGDGDNLSGPYTGQSILQSNIESPLTNLTALATYSTSTRTTITFTSAKIIGSSGATAPKPGMVITGSGISSNPVTVITAVGFASSTYTLTINNNTTNSANIVDGLVQIGYPIDLAASTSTVNSKGNSIIVPNDKEWPSSGTIVVDNEHIRYDSIDKTGNVGTTAYNATLSLINSWALTNLTRASDNTLPAAHSIGSGTSLNYSPVDNYVTVDQYTFDNNIYTLQSALEGVKQVTTDVLAHKAKVRYFKPDVTLMYTNGSNTSQIKESIRQSLLIYFEEQYFGSTVQLSDILQTIHNTVGVDNVKWSKDLLTGSQTTDSYIKTVSAAGKTYTYTTVNAHKLSVGDTVTISGFNIDAYNGQFKVATIPNIGGVPSTTQFTVTGTVSSPGTVPVVLQSGTITTSAGGTTITFDPGYPSDWGVGSTVNEVGAITNWSATSSLTIISKTPTTITLSAAPGSSLINFALTTSNYISVTPVPQYSSDSGTALQSGTITLTASTTATFSSGVPAEWVVGSRLINTGSITGFPTASPLTIISKTATTIELSAAATAGTTTLNSSVYITAYPPITKVSKTTVGTSDSDGNPRNRLTETDVYGNPIVGAFLDKIQVGGNKITPTKYNFYFAGDPTLSTMPTSGSVMIDFNSLTSATINIDYLNTLTDNAAACAYINTQINDAYKLYNPSSTVLVTVDIGTSATTTKVPDRLNQFTITFVDKTINADLTITDAYLSGGSGAYNSDFVLGDDELITLPDGVITDNALAIDTVMTVRVKSQSTWNIA